MDKDYLGIGLQDGYLKLVWSFHYKNATEFSELEDNLLDSSRSLSRSLPLAGFLADGEWHVVFLKMDKANITLVVDEMLAYVEEPGLVESSEYDVVDMFYGGIPETENSIAKRSFPQSFKGCIDNLQTSEKAPSILNYTEVYSENVKSCQLFP